MMEEDSGSWLSLTTGLVIGSLGLLALYIWKVCRVYNTFKDMGIPGPKPVPLLGNLSDAMKLGFTHMFDHYGKEFGKVYGMFFMTSPSIVISDLEMLRDILVKKFQYFPNRSDQGGQVKPFKDMLSGLRDDHWKHVRSTLSPTFSSGKIKRVIPRIQRVTQRLTDYLRDKAAKGEMVELKELSGRFAIDAIAGVAFGIDVDSIHNPDDQFVKRAHTILNPPKLLMTLFIMCPKLPRLLRFLGIKVALTKAAEFFTDVTEMAIKDRREDTTTKHHDFLQLLVEAEREGDNQGPVDAEINHKDLLNTSAQWTRKGLTMDEMQANSLIFFLAGYETVAAVISFTLFCLANNPECLKLAQEEVDKKLGKKVVDYETANELTYLEMCVNETSRLYPPGFVLDRQANADVEVGAGGLKIKKDMKVLVPVKVIHMDPDIWPEPEKFDPQRHTAEARGNRHPFAFMPFGMGPRNCIGMRLAQIKVRMAVATVLQHFNPVLCEKSVYPPEVLKIRMWAKDGLWIKLQPRE